MTRPSWLLAADGASPWEQAHVVVAGIGVSGFAAADGLLQFGARVTVLDERADEVNADKGALLEVLGGTVRLGPGSTAVLPEDADLVITTGWAPANPLLVAAASISSECAGVWTPGAGRRDGHLLLPVSPRRMRTVDRTPARGRMTVR